VDLVVGPVKGLHGSLRVPGDKSVTHRAYLLAAVARGTTTIDGANEGADCAATLRAVAALGAIVEAKGPGSVAITGRPDGFDTPADGLDLGNSGTGMRLLAGLLAGRNVEATLAGDASLSARPMQRILEPLAAMGAHVEALGANGRPPLFVRGTQSQRGGGRRLEGRSYASPIASAQVKSCLLLAGLAADGVTTVVEPAASRDHTERMLPVFGVPCSRPDEHSCRISGPVVPVAPGRIDVCGDFSAAFFWLVAGSILPAGTLTIEGVGINPTRTGALTVLRRMGAHIKAHNERTLGGEPVADLVVKPSKLSATDIAPSEIPSLIDELPALAIAQARAAGTSTVRGAAELRVKESDRITRTVLALGAIGVKADETQDGWSITGGEFTGGAVETHGDHRLGMAFAVAGLVSKEAVRVRDSHMIDTSYPRFYNDLRDRVTSR
jgi:3-phosphoshikimate 1-carboxyvinyltransferase